MTAEQAILALLEERGPGRTICPSEAAKRLAGPQGDWRAVMGVVHESVDALHEKGEIALSRKGEPISRRRGAYRIARRRPGGPRTVS
ncbi:DUF3253 domain-containing protein [Erythrobacter sp. HL-111]|uniref:DUF3253 domain-containing protein n=1 Tax=Erythrobacter sp. HL-111 TaxID=1798193 RepID=UPI0006DAE0AE|nr:DUF3253 domain-containing protein [Erythrobacter sp. HL-111]KPP82425.1 MAG: Protein of unknown function (DUF3253) [Erythrobacteraceae bacterium HL-111]SDS42399.1 Protein of unknown function [Erythrobacter sp. HL-111]